MFAAMRRGHGKSNAVLMFVISQMLTPRRIRRRNDVPQLHRGCCMLHLLLVSRRSHCQGMGSLAIEQGISPKLRLDHPTLTNAYISRIRMKRSLYFLILYHSG